MSESQRRKRQPVSLDPVSREYLEGQFQRDVGHAIGMQTIAEFVENDQVKQRLVEIGVDFAQGYGLGKPEPIDNILIRSAETA